MKKTALTIILILGLWFTTSVGAFAAAKYTITPSSGTYSNGTNIAVTIGIDSGTEKVYAGDLWMVFDASKLEFVDAVAVGAPAFPMQLGQKNFDNTAGTVNIALIPYSTTTNLSEVAKGDLVTMTFKAKNTGTATLGFSCTQGNDSDTNIVSNEYRDVIDCASNQSGSYTIQAGVGGQTTPTTGVSTPTTGVSTPTRAASSLPQTGILTPTLSLVVVGLIGLVAGAFFLL